MATQPEVEVAESPVQVTLAPGLSRIRAGRFPFAVGRGGLAAEGAWVIAGQTFCALALLVGVRLLTEVVPPETFAAVSLIVGVLTLGRNIFCFPFFQAALRFFPEASREGKIIVLRRSLVNYLRRASLALSALIVVGGLASRAWSSTSVLIIPLLIGLLLTDVFRTMETDLFNASRRQKASAVVRMAEALARPTAAVLAVWLFGPTALSVLLGYLCATAAVCAGLVLSGVPRVGVAIGPEESFHDDKISRTLYSAKLWTFALPLVPLAVLEWASVLGDRYLIGGLIGLEAAGIYAAAYGLMNQPFAMAHGMIEQIARPWYFEAVASGESSRVRRTFRIWLLATGTVCGLGVLAVTLLRGPLARILLAEHYRGAVEFFPYIAAGNAMLAMGLVYEKVAHAANRPGLVVAGRVVGAVSSVAVGVPMILRFGVRGAAMAAPVYFGLQLAFSWWYARRLSAASVGGV